MKLICGIFLLILTVMNRSEASNALYSSSIETSLLNYSSNNYSESLLKELKSAQTISTTGAFFFVVGSIMEISGYVAPLLKPSNDLSQNYSSRKSSINGLGLKLGGLGAMAVGNITACAGGGKTRKILNNKVGIAPEFRGWKLFWGGFALSLISNLIPLEKVPVVPYVVGSGGLILSIASVVHSVGYSVNACNNKLSCNNLSLSPVVLIEKNNTMYGLVLNAGF